MNKFLNARWPQINTVRKMYRIFLLKAAKFESGTTVRTSESWRRREKPVIF